MGNGAERVSAERVHAIGIDLAWGAHPTGVAHLVGPVPDGPDSGTPWRLLESRTVPGIRALDAWVGQRLPADAPAWIAVDAPLVATNPAGTQRAADLALTRDFRRFRVFCMPVDDRHARRGVELRAAFAERGIGHASPGATAGATRRGVFETFPTAAQLSLFDLSRPLRYKRGTTDMRREGLRALQMRLAMFEDAAVPIEETGAWRTLLRRDPMRLRGAEMKALEDELDAVLCALVAALAWRAPRRLLTYGDLQQGAITVPHPPVPL